VRQIKNSSFWDKVDKLSFPPKKLFFKLKQDVIQRRKMELEHFMNALGSNPYMLKYDEFRLFIQIPLEVYEMLIEFLPNQQMSFLETQQLFSVKPAALGGSVRIDNKSNFIVNGNVYGAAANKKKNIFSSMTSKTSDSNKRHTADPPVEEEKKEKFIASPPGMG
jgi:hypothetical protein